MTFWNWQESASLADRLIQYQVTRAQEAEETYALKNNLSTTKQKLLDTSRKLEEANTLIGDIKDRVSVGGQKKIKKSLLYKQLKNVDWNKLYILYSGRYSPFFLYALFALIIWGWNLKQTEFKTGQIKSSFHDLCNDKHIFVNRDGVKEFANVKGQKKKPTGQI